MNRAKTIKLLLDDGSLKGIITVEDNQWNLGELYSSPKDKVDNLISQGITNKYGIYLLLSDEMVYIGQSSDLSRRLRQHILGKEWWKSVVILTTKDDSFTKSDIDYLERKLIEKAIETNRLDVDNHKIGNSLKVDRFREVELDQYLEEALFLLKLIGVNVFTKIKKSKNKNEENLIPVLDTNSNVSINMKTQAKKFLKEKEYDLPKYSSYAKKSEKNEYWINPKIECIEEDWAIILNDQESHQLIYIMVPANSLSVQGESTHIGLRFRQDKPFYLQVYINASTFVDRISGIDFSQYIVDRVEY